MAGKILKVLINWSCRPDGGVVAGESSIASENTL